MRLGSHLCPDGGSLKNTHRLVAGPAVKVLSSRPNVDLVIASNSLESAAALAAPHENATAVLLDAGDQTTLEELIKGADVVLRSVVHDFTDTLERS